MKQKTLREDRTAAEKKYVACRDPPQAENLACEILCSFVEKTLLYFGDYAEKIKYIVCLVDTAYNI